jgi:glycosyltransferase involved in cell wall biosynthesis
MCDPRFSILIPSKNRIELLRYAISSITNQDYESVEIVIADNASDCPYESMITYVGSINLRFLRSEKPISVTENWNRALAAARGDYFIMLGDDDALTPGLLKRLDALITKAGQPGCSLSYGLPLCLSGRV